MTTATISKGAMLPLRQLAKQQGIDSLALGLPDEMGEYLSCSQVGEAWTRMGSHCGDRELGFRLAAGGPVALCPRARLLGLLANVSDTVADGFFRTRRWWRLYGYTPPTCIEGDSTWVVRWLPAAARGGCSREMDQFHLLTVAQYVLTGAEGAKLLAIHLEQPLPGRQRFEFAGARIRYNQPTMSLVFSRETPALKMSQCDTTLAGLLDCSAGVLLERLQGETSCKARVRELLLAHREGLGISLTRAAKQLGVSTRTLQRQLQREGESYRQVREEVRLLLATQAMEIAGVSPQRATKIAGFESTSSLHRLLKRSGLRRIPS